MGALKEEPIKSTFIFGFEKLQEKTALLFSLLVSILMVLLASSDYILGLNRFIVFLKLGMTIPFFVGYLVIRKYGLKPYLVHILLLFAITGIYFNFMNNDGYRGPTIYTFFIFMIIYSVLLRGWERLVWFVGSLFFYIAIFYLDVNGKLAVISNYSDESSLFWDHFVTILWCSVFVFICLYVFITQYKNQTNALNRLRTKQQENIAEIRRVNDQKDRLLALLSHDLKNPIGTLTTTLSLMDEGVFETKEIERILSSLKEQSYHLNKVLNNTLSYVLTEIQSESQNKEERRVVEFSSEIREVMQVQAKQKDQNIDFVVKGKDKEVVLEINEISIILKNLLDNAIKFSQIGATVTFILEIEGALIRWMIINEGVEIPESEHSEIFKFRVKPSYGTSKEKGTGLGLPLSKKIADSNGLILGFESSSFKTVFYLEKEL